MDILFFFLLPTYSTQILLHTINTIAPSPSICTTTFKYSLPLIAPSGPTRSHQAQFEIFPLLQPPYRARDPHYILFFITHMLLKAFRSFTPSIKRTSTTLNHSIRMSSSIPVPTDFVSTPCFAKNAMEKKRKTMLIGLEQGSLHFLEGCRSRGPLSY